MIRWRASNSIFSTSLARIAGMNRGCLTSIIFSTSGAGFWLLSFEGETCSAAKKNGLVVKVDKLICNNRWFALEYFENRMKLVINLSRSNLMKHRYLIIYSMYDVVLL